MKYKYGIYEVRNTFNGKRYIGKGQLDTRRRMHFRLLNRGFHHNRHLQNAFNKYGKDRFVFNILLYCSPEDIGFYECLAVSKWETYKREYGYNLDIPNEKGAFTHAEETKQKIREANSGENHYLFGKHRSKEAIRKTSEAVRGNRHPLYGKNHKKESRLKMAVSKGSKKFGVYKDDKLIGIWIVKSWCAEELGIQRQKIYLCLDGRRNTHYGYTFKYI